MVVEPEGLEIAVAELRADLQGALAMRERRLEVSAALERDHAQKPLEITLLDALWLAGQKAFCPRHRCRSDRGGALGVVILCERQRGDGCATAVPGVHVAGESTLAC